MVALEPLKREFLDLLDRDLEFRYAVAGYLGLSEILKRLDALAEEQAGLREEQIRLREEQTKIWSEIAGIREEQTKIWEEIKALREEQIRLREEQTKIWEEIKALREEQTKIWAEIARLREDFTRAFKGLDTRLSRVERTLEKITLDIEDEARIVVKYRLRDMGCEADVDSLILPDVEINLYGVSDELCIIGEASVRASSSIIDEINRNIEKLRSLYPDRLRPKIVRVIYTSLAMPDLVERAEKEGIWVLKATGDIVKPRDLPLS